VGFRQSTGCCASSVEYAILAFDWDFPIRFYDQFRYSFIQNTTEIIYGGVLIFKHDRIPGILDALIYEKGGDAISRSIEPFHLVNKISFKNSTFLDLEEYV